jgi:hypothetical protein
MYTIADYATMMADAARIDAYAAALRQRVRSDSIVADLGAGTGIFSLLAAQLGAARIYAIEPDDAIHVAQALAVANRLGDRIDFMQARSTEISLPQPATIIVSDMRGTLPLYEEHVPAIVDARERLLAPDGVLIPERDRLWAAIVEAPELWADHVTPCRSHTYGLTLGPIQDLLVNSWTRARIADEQVVSSRQCVAVLDYRTIDNPNLDVEATCAIARDAKAHGICLWFDSELAHGIGFSNAPGTVAAIHAQAFFPFADALIFSAGETVSVRLQANLVGDNYVWQWSCRGRTQSTLHSVPLDAKHLSKGAGTYRPELGLEGEIDLFVLSRMQESIPVADIARELLNRFPSALRDWNAALGRAGELSRRYAKG